MASPSKVKAYLAHWLQLGKSVLMKNGGLHRKPKETIAGESYSPEFEELWFEVQAPESGHCYLTGTEETVADLMTSEWEIVDCPRCSMPQPLRTRGMPPMSCPCNDLPNWPNQDIPAPRSPVSNRNELQTIRDRLAHMALRADLYASSIGTQPADYPLPDQALAWLRHQNELILNSAGEGICGLDEQMKLTFLNPAAERMLGYGPAEAIGHPVQILLRMTHPPNPSNPSGEFPIDETLKQGSVKFITDGVFWRKDGTCFPVEYISAPLRQKGEIVGVVLTFKDITERIEIERMKDEFISIVSHELRTPLTSIRGSLGLLASGVLANKPDKSQRMLTIALENSDRLLRLLNDILDMERMASGKVAIVKQPCHAGELMQRGVDSIQALAEEASVSIVVEPGEVILWADADRLIQVFTNLLSNAIKFSTPGSTVWLRASVQSTHILFQVKDCGRGIPPERLEKIFERFQQVDSSDSRAHGGTGLGLAICEKIVQQHGGRIWAESTLGQGSTFSFTIQLPESTPQTDA